MQESVPAPARVTIDRVTYPVTGYRCPRCGIPRIPVDGLTLHPWCQYEKDHETTNNTEETLS